MPHYPSLISLTKTSDKSGSLFYKELSQYTNLNVIINPSFVPHNIK